MTTSTEQELIERWRLSVEDFIVSDIRNCLDNDIIEVGLIILTLSAMESISGYFVGSRANKTTFTKFLKSHYYPPSYHPIAERLYPLRNGLFHDYASDQNTFVFFRTRDQGFSHLQQMHTNYGLTIALNRELFAMDFLHAWNKFANDAINNEETSAKVLARIRDTTRGFLVVTEIKAQAPQTMQDGTTTHINMPTYSSNPSSYSSGTVSHNERSEEKSPNS